MKKLIIILLVLITTESQSQKVDPINVNFFEIVRNSNNYSYSNNTYVVTVPYSIDWNNTGLQGRYDWAINNLRTENNKFINLTLINQDNAANLNTFHITVASKVKTWNAVDFSVWNNYQQGITYLTYFLNVSTVRDEILLLHKISSEISKLKQSAPDTYYTSQRFYKMVSLMNELYSCPRTEISAVGYKYGLF